MSEEIALAIGDLAFWQQQAHDTMAELHETQAQHKDLSRQIGELHTTIGYQDAMLAQLRADAATLRAIVADAVGFAWSTNPRDSTNPKSAASVFDRAHAALAIDHPGAQLLAELEAARAVVAAARAYQTAVAELNGISDGEKALWIALSAYDAAVKASDK